MTKELLHQLLDNSKDLYFVLDESTHVIYANEAAKEVYNYKVNSSTSFLNYVHPDDKDSIQQMLSLLLNNPSSSHHATFRIRHEAQDWRIFESRCWADDTTKSGIRLLISAHDASSRVQAQMELRRKKNQLDRAQRVVNLGTWELNLTTSELSGSDHFYKLYGLSPRESMSFLTLQEQFHPDDLEKIHGVIQRAQETMGVFDVDHRIIRTDNVERVLHLRGQVDYIGNEFLMYGIARDVTEIRSIKKALKRTERRFEAIFDATFEFIGLLNLEGTLVEINETALRFGGLEEEDVIGKPFWECAWWKISAETQDKLRNEIVNASKGDFIRYNTEIYGAGHEVVTMDFSIKPVVDSENEVTLLIVEGRDISEEVKREKEQHRTLQQLSSLAAKLHKIQEEERTRLAREVHDVLGQATTALRLDIHWLKENGPHDDEQYQERAARTLHQIDETIGMVRRISHELRPGILDHLGIVAAIEWLAGQIEERAEITFICNNDYGEDLEDLDQNLATALFRIFQEATTNIIRHAEATAVEVNFSKSAENLILLIADNGKGIGEKDLQGSSSLGILNMKERLLPWAGNLSITGAPGKGTMVEVSVPYS